MQSVDMTKLKRLDGDFEHVLREIPGARMKMHERIGIAVRNEVSAQINVSGLDDSRGKIKNWQEHFVGSLGGYAAIRAVRGLGPSGYNDSPGAITNYLENGHRIRPPGQGKRSRVTHSYVNGYHFYEAARETADAIAYAEAEKYADEIADMLEG